MPRRTKTLFWPAAAAVLASMSGAAFAQTHEASTAPAAVFEDFVYRGSDLVHEGLKPGAGAYLNPILQGFYPDPSVTRPCSRTRGDSTSSRSLRSTSPARICTVIMTSS